VPIFFSISRAQSTPNREVTVHKDLVYPLARQFFLQGAHDLFVGQSIAPVEQDHLQLLRFYSRFRKGYNGRAGTGSGAHGDAP
jgi:hypothetical protein